MAVVAQQRTGGGIASACAALSVARASVSRRQYPKGTRPRRPRFVPRALPPEERTRGFSVLNDDRFADRAPAQVYATLLDEGPFLCSIPTMYRILRENRLVRDRRNQRRHPTDHQPDLLATGPNEVWSWDITKLLGPVTWTSFHLYVILALFSRYVVGWLVAPRESAALAPRLSAETCAMQRSGSGQVFLHADRGTAMTSKPVALLLADLGGTRSPSRPQVSNDNPFSEAQFTTLKYRPDFPARFGSLEDARVFCQAFFTWYNGEHCHAGHWADDADRRPRRAGLDGACRPAAGAQCRLRRTPRALREEAAPPTQAASGGLDQPAEGRLGLAGSRRCHELVRRRPTGFPES
jgi:putative transposase